MDESNLKELYLQSVSEGKFDDADIYLNKLKELKEIKELKDMEKIEEEKLHKTPIQKEIDRIFFPNKEGISNWIYKEELEKTLLGWGNNGVMRHGIFKNDNRYVWETKRKNNKSNGTILAIRTNGINKNLLLSKSRPIRPDISKYHNSIGCVVCGSFSDLVTDHKNDLYNDLRVLNSKTQNIDDFQCLCNHCNLQKREIAKKTRKTAKRYGATKIPSLATFGIDFIEGDETFDKDDVNAMVGTYWYDPVKFMNYIKTNLKSL